MHMGLILIRCYRIQRQLVHGHKPDRILPVPMQQTRPELFFSYLSPFLIFKLYEKYDNKVKRFCAILELCFKRQQETLFSVIFVHL